MLKLTLRITAKKCAALVLALVLAFGMSLDFFALAADYEPPTGAIAISTEQDLRNIQNNLEGNYYLTQNIVLDDLGIRWMPIGTVAEPFTGTLDGQGFEITGLIVDKSPEDAIDYQGMFGHISGATIRNLTLSSGRVVGKENVGAIAGYSADSVIENCTNNLSVSGKRRVGGIVGYAASSEIVRCVNNASVSLTAWDGAYGGGIVGILGQESTVSGCWNTGYISAFEESTEEVVFQASHLGGLVGWAGGLGYGTIVNSNVHIRDSKNEGEVFGTSYVGGIVGTIRDHGSVERCYNTGGVTATRPLILSVGNAGGIAGAIERKGLVTNCYNTGDVRSAGSRVSASKLNGSDGAGGIAGAMDTDSRLTYCYNTGSVTAETGSVVNSSFDGEPVSFPDGGRHVGGIVGSAARGVENNIALPKSLDGNYELPFSVTGVIAGIYDYSSPDNPVVPNNYASTGIATIAQNDAEKMYPLKNFFEQSPYEELGWDFDNIWKMPEGVENAFPALKWQDGDYPVCEESRLTSLVGVDVPFWSGVSGRQRIIRVLWGDLLFSDEYATNNRTYDNTLATACMAVSAAAYNGEREKGYFIDAALTSLGFEDIALYHYPGHAKNQKVASALEFDTGFSFGHKMVTISGKTVPLIIVVVKGTDGLKDWLRDFSVEFTKSTHAGFQNAADEVHMELHKYLLTNNLLSSAAENRILITGHSLGGAVTNLLAQKLTNDRNYASADNIYAYSFATPNTAKFSTVSEERQLGNIFNIVIAEDLVPGAPPTGFYWKYGKTLVFPSGKVNHNEYVNSYKHALAAEFDLLTGRDKNHKAENLLTDISHYSPVDAWARVTVRFWADIYYSHAPDTYLAFLRTTSPKYIEFSGTYVSIACPVDVEIYNSENILVGKIVDNVAGKTIETEVVIFIEDDTKIVHLPFEGVYTFKLTGSDSGTMDFSALGVSIVSGETTEEKLFKNVTLTDGKQMSVQVDTEGSLSNMQLFVVDNNGSPTKEIHIDGTETNITSDGSNGGNDTGENNLVGGTPATATPSTLSETSGEDEKFNNPFIDVFSSDWFYDDVKYVAENGLFNGTSANTFSPQMPMTRAMVFTVLARLADIDVDGAELWYALALEWGVEIGLTDGSNPDGNITREQLVTLLWRFAGLPDADGELDFADAADVSDWATEAMAWAVSLGILNGNDNGALNPLGEATRAEVAVILHRFAEVKK